MIHLVEVHFDYCITSSEKHLARATAEKSMHAAGGTRKVKSADMTTSRKQKQEGEK